MTFQDQKFDKACIYMFRKMTKNLMLMHREATVNEMQISLAGIAEGVELEEYIEKFVMHM